MCFGYSTDVSCVIQRKRYQCSEKRHGDNVDDVTEARTGLLGLLYPFSSA